MARVKIPNETTSISVDKTVAEIMQILKDHGARGIYSEYAANGKIMALSFEVEFKDGLVPIRVPVNVDGLRGYLRKAYASSYDPPALRDDQPDKIAWRLAKDYIKYAVSMRPVEMVDLPEIFMGQILSDGKRTMYEQLVAGNFDRMLPGEGETYVAR